ncbi:MAG: flagellar protein FlgN [Betaproteobacteria bacterium]|nr:flagellar protein FlgN [Betaproteobacteria bacterium]
MPNRQVFVDSLRQEREGFARFLSLLHAESAALLRGDVAELLELAQQKSDQVARLGTLGETRRSFLEQEGFGTDRVGMAEWLIVHGGRDQASLSALWNALLADAENAKALNTTNGILIESRLRFNQAALATLRGAMQQATLYGPDGSPDLQGNATRALGTA